MTLWDLFFTSQPTAPPQLGGVVFLVADLIGSGGASVYSICFFQRLSKLLVLGAVDPVADYQLLVFSSSLAFFRESSFLS